MALSISLLINRLIAGNSVCCGTWDRGHGEAPRGPMAEASKWVVGGKLYEDMAALRGQKTKRGFTTYEARGQSEEREGVRRLSQEIVYDAPTVMIIRAK